MGEIGDGTTAKVYKARKIQTDDASEGTAEQSELVALKLLKLGGKITE